MARSEYIYVAALPGQDVPVAVFTVKRELRQMLIRMDRESPSVIQAMRLFRMADGPGGFRAEMVIRDVIDGK